MNSRVFYRMSERKTYHEKEKENEVQVIIDPWHFSLSMSFHEVLVSEIEDNDTKGLIHDSVGRAFQSQGAIGGTKPWWNKDGQNQSS